MKHFRVLSILYYIWAGFFGFLLILLPLVNYLSSPTRFREELLSELSELQSQLCTIEPWKGESCDQWVIVFAISILIFFAVYMVLNLMAASNYKRISPSSLNWVVASFNLFSFPVGTALGVYSLYVLTQYLKKLREEDVNRVEID